MAISPKLDLDISFTSSVEKFFTILLPLNFDSEFKVSGRIGWALAPFCVDSASFSSVGIKMKISQPILYNLERSG